MIKSVAITKLTDSGRLVTHVDDKVIVEQPITIIIKDFGSFTILCTPDNIQALAVGFAFTEGMITTIDDIISISELGSELNTIILDIKHKPQSKKRRNLIISSACGLCEARNIDKLLENIPALAKNIFLNFSHIENIVNQLLEQQILYQTTGATHAAGFFNQNGDLVTLAEDIGRHNALDKIIGQGLLKQMPVPSYGIIISSRISFELVAKTALAGLEIIIAVSAPSSLAIKAAKKWGITLLGFTRPGRTNIYTHPERIISKNRI